MTGAWTEVEGSQSVDCVIFGAGMGGALLALLLGRRGHSVLVVESRPDTPSRGAEILKPRGIRILAEHGLLGELMLRGALRRKVIDFHHDGSPLFSYDFTEHTELGYFLIAPYDVTVGTILEACDELPNVDIRFGRRPADVHAVDAEVAEVVLDNGAVIRAQVYVDAGGAASSLSELVVENRMVCEYDHVLRMATVPVTPSILARNRLYFDSSGWFAYFYPVTAELARVFVGLPQALDVPVFREHDIDLTTRLATFVTHSDDALVLLDPGRFVSAPLSVHHRTPYHDGNVVLLGSAVFSPHPMTGQGMSYTMEDATVLAEILSEACNGGDLAGSVRQRYRPRCSMHSELIAYGDALATSYHDRAAYLATHRARFHGGDR
ncbi:FAD-dependent monooxygenase [Nocardia paucivorans]|uniref:FAD-dependent monooxygenase n=1 Tax=Nocardia paucivorans TaxID=114259 RepID=UPI0005939E13|nr:FAD-dependent monooxygenase [Nocardia paucivorans]